VIVSAARQHSIQVAVLGAAFLGLAFSTWAKPENEGDPSSLHQYPNKTNSLSRLKSHPDTGNYAEDFYYKYSHSASAKIDLHSLNLPTEHSDELAKPPEKKPQTSQSSSHVPFIADSTVATAAGIGTYATLVPKKNRPRFLRSNKRLFAVVSITNLFGTGLLVVHDVSDLKKPPDDNVQSSDSADQKE
jgi:hypothetical protein